MEPRDPRGQPPNLRPEIEGKMKFAEACFYASFWLIVPFIAASYFLSLIGR